jgi:hypothetical protein
VDLRPFRNPDDLAGQRRLFEDAFPEHRGTVVASEAHYAWKFRGFPGADPPPQEFVATEGGTLLGYYAALPYAYRLGGRLARIGVVCDVMTHSEARGKGVFYNLGRYSLAEMGTSGIDIAVAFPVRPPSLAGLKKMGFAELFPLPVYVAPLRARSTLRRARLELLAPLTDALLAGFRRLTRPRLPAGLGVQRLPIGELLDRVESDPAEAASFDDLRARWASAVPNTLVKDVRFLRWRLGAPGAHYTCHLVTSQVRWEALAITRCAELKGVPTCCILDWIAPAEEWAVNRAVVASVFAEALAGDSELVGTLMPAHLARRRRLLRQGFLRSAFGFRYIACQTSAALGIAEIADPRSWNLMWIDSDDL